MSDRVGELVKRRRQLVGMTQGDLAKSAGVTREWISQVESGRIEQPGFKQLETVAVALEVPAESLLAAAGYHVEYRAIPPQRPLIDLVRELLQRLEEQEHGGKSDSEPSDWRYVSSPHSAVFASV